jgi:sorbitol/mannitol transport system substrate-binding protein
LNTTTRTLAFIGASAIVLSACPPPSAVAQSQTTLTIATVNNPQMVDMQHAVGDFEKSTGIKVNFETLPENTLRQKVTADIATGGGQFDIATVGTYEVPIWAKNKWITDLTPYFDKLDAKGKADYDLADVIPSIRKGLSYQDALYAVPFYGESSMTFYNKRLFKAAGLTMPEHPTWDQVAGFAQKLNDPSKNQYGICLRGLPGWGEMGAPMTTVINTFGGQWFDMQWKPTLNSGATKDAITFYRHDQEVRRTGRILGGFHRVRDQLHPGESRDVGRRDVGFRRHHRSQAVPSSQGRRLRVFSDQGYAERFALAVGLVAYNGSVGQAQR